MARAPIASRRRRRPLPPTIPGPRRPSHLVPTARPCLSIVCPRGPGHFLSRRGAGGPAAVLRRSDSRNGHALRRPARPARRKWHSAVLPKFAGRGGYITLSEIIASDSDSEDSAPASPSGGRGRHGYPSRGSIIAGIHAPQIGAARFQGLGGQNSAQRTGRGYRLGLGRPSGRPPVL